MIQMLADAASTRSRFDPRILSIQVDKPHDPGLPGQTEVVPLSALGRPLQLLRLASAVYRHRHRTELIHFVGNGKQALLLCFGLLARMLGKPFIVSFLGRKQHPWLPRNLTYVHPFPRSSRAPRVRSLSITPVSTLPYAPVPSAGLSTVAFASVPKRCNQFRKAGLDLIRDAARELPDLEFHVLNRFDYLTRDLERCFESVPNVVLHHEVFKDVGDAFARFDAFIAPYVESGLAEMPLSLIEAVCLGKPVLVSRTIAFSRLVEQYRAGETFEPDVASLRQALVRLRASCGACAANTRSLYEQELSYSAGVERYLELYRSHVSPGS